MGSKEPLELKFYFKKTKVKLTGWIAYTLSKSEQRTPGRTKKRQELITGIGILHHMIKLMIFLWFQTIE